MLEWGTLAVAVIAAAAAVYAGVISRQQLILSKKAMEPALPLVQVTAREYADYLDWCVLDVSIQNRADIPFDIEEASMDTPKDALLLGMESLPTKPGNQPWEPAEVIGPPPLADAVSRLKIGHRIGPAGANGEYGPRGSGTFQILVHLRLSRFHHGETPKVILALRWRNHAAQTFAIAATVISPKIT